MKKIIAKLVLGTLGWTVDESLKTLPKQVVILCAPHTSNWDTIIALPVFWLLDLKIRFTLKDEFMRVPLKWLFGPLGAIAINRRPRKPGEERPSTVEAMTHLFEDNPQLCLLVTPEGTRSLRTEWKTGFYYVAKNAGVPMALGYLDFEKKLAGIGKVIQPSDDMERDLRQIMAFYKPIKGKHPELFSVDLRYDDPPKNLSNNTLDL
jgi:1-acyl-sn-glycerol-3-phosphate acyltransferase